MQTDSDIRHHTAHLFRFTVPNLPEMAFVIAQQEVVEVSEIPPLTRVPFAPFFVIGISKWRARLLTVIDMASAFLSSHPKTPFAESNRRYLITQTAIDTGSEFIAWPVEIGSRVQSVSSQVLAAEKPPHLNPAMMRTVIHVENETLIWLNVEGIVQSTLDSGLARIT